MLKIQYKFLFVWARLFCAAIKFIFISSLSHSDAFFAGFFFFCFKLALLENNGIREKERKDVFATCMVPTKVQIKIAFILESNKKN